MGDLTCSRMMLMLLFAQCSRLNAFLFRTIILNGDVCMCQWYSIKHRMYRMRTMAGRELDTPSISRFGGDRLLLLMPLVQLLQLMRLRYSHAFAQMAILHHRLCIPPPQIYLSCIRFELRDIIQALNLYLPVSKLNLKHFLFIRCTKCSFATLG